MSDYQDCKAKKLEWMQEAKTPGLEPEVRKLFVEMAVMYRSHAQAWKNLGE